MCAARTASQPAADAGDPFAGVVQRLASGETRVLARAVSLIENQDERGFELVERVYAAGSEPWVIGFTGVGGAGKSTLVPKLALRFAEMGEKVAILAVDPSSPFSGGAVLGDRIRGLEDPHHNIYFRSIASRGGQGGLATCVGDVIGLMGAAGRGVVLVETIGAGQSEVAIRDVAHTVVLVAAPGLGDEIQAMKAGIIEIGALVVVNKADRPGADETVNTLRHVLALAPHARHLDEGYNAGNAQCAPRWRTPVLKTVATTGAGVDALLERLGQHRRYLQESGEFAKRGLERARARMRERLKSLAYERLLARAAEDGTLESVDRRLAAGETDPLRAARELVEALIGKGRV